MDLRPDDSLNPFREEVRRVIAQDLPADMEARQRAFGGVQSDMRDSTAWTRILAKRGWTVPHWPKEHGGLGWSPMQLFVFQEELDAAYAPITSWAGSHMVGPVVYTFGSDEQKARFLPAIREGEYLWAQGFSEPGSGSDLANLRTQAVLEGDKYVVNGQKIWTSTAHVAEWGFFLVRTDPTVKPQRGISFLLIDMKTPGIMVRQIPMINGDAELCEVFLDNVEVPANNLVGEPGAGWTYAKYLLDHERTASSFIYFNKREIKRAQEIAKAESLNHDPVFQTRIAKLEAEVTALEWSVLRTLSGEEYRYNETAVASVLKVAGSRLQQAITELQVDLLGPKATRFFAIDMEERDKAPLWPEHVAGRMGAALSQRAATIFGGTLQVQKNIIAKLAFGL